MAQHILSFSDKTCRYRVILEELHRHPTAKTRRLLRMILKAPQENREAIECIDNVLPALILDRTMAEREAARRVVQAENADLFHISWQDHSITKHILDRTIKLQEIWNALKN